MWGAGLEPVWDRGYYDGYTIEAVENFCRGVIHCFDLKDNVYIFSRLNMKIFDQGPEELLDYMIEHKEFILNFNDQSE